MLHQIVRPNTVSNVLAIDHTYNHVHDCLAILTQAGPSDTPPATESTHRNLPGMEPNKHVYSKMLSSFCLVSKIDIGAKLIELFNFAQCLLEASRRPNYLE